MRIGLFLGYEPQVSLRKEGLGRYLGKLVEGLIAGGHQVEIACPRWLEKNIKELLYELHIPLEKVIWHVGKKEPPIWKLYLKMIRKPKRMGFIGQIIGFVDRCLGWYLCKLLQIENGIIFVGYILMSIMAAAVGLIPFLILMLLIMLLVQTEHMLKKVKNQSFFSKIYAHLNKIDLGFGDSVNTWLSGYNLLNSNVVKSLINQINEEEGPDVWYIPSLFWPETSELKGNKVFCAPDLVTREYPIAFRNIVNTEYSTFRCEKTVYENKYFITYCEYLKESLLINQFSKERLHIRAIPHSNNDLLPFIRLDETALRYRSNSNENFSKKYAKQICGLGDSHYIFYASQVRPYKNILNMIKAYNHLLRTQKINCKLVLTGNLHASEKILMYISDHQLEHDLICMSNVSTTKLAALYCCADMVVNPTLYEGGFPFTFGEGMSVGTPSIMSDIPQVRDVLGPAGLEEVMFDPYDWEAIAKAIEYWLPRRDELYQKELPLYKKMAERTPEVVAEEYIHAFEYFIELEKNEKVG